MISGFNVLQGKSFLCAKRIAFTNYVSPWRVTTKVKRRSQLQCFISMPPYNQQGQAVLEDQ